MIEFVILTAVTTQVIAGAFLVAFTRHVLHAIIGLGLCMLGISVFFLWLGSPFVAAMQVLIYIGGVSVAMVFAMMLSTAMSRNERNTRRLGFALLEGIVVFVGIASVILGSSFNVHEPVGSEQWALERVGQSLLGEYGLVFEVLSLILLFAILGAVIVARKDVFHVQEKEGKG
jgi:NADH:ubiquinone oxidoreductase subunit 6 (subunit J)